MNQPRLDHTYGSSLSECSAGFVLFVGENRLPQTQSPMLLHNCSALVSLRRG